MPTTLDLEDLAILVGNVDADLDVVAAREGVTPAQRDRIWFAQSHLRTARGYLNAALGISTDPKDAARPDAAAAQ